MGRRQRELRRQKQYAKLQSKQTNLVGMVLSDNFRQAVLTYNQELDQAIAEQNALLDIIRAKQDAGVDLYSIPEVREFHISVQKAFFIPSPMLRYLQGAFTKG